MRRAGRPKEGGRPALADAGALVVEDAGRLRVGCVSVTGRRRPYRKHGGHDGRRRRDRLAGMPSDSRSCSKAKRSPALLQPSGQTPSADTGQQTQVLDCCEEQQHQCDRAPYNSRHLPPGWKLPNHRAGQSGERALDLAKLSFDASKPRVDPVELCLEAIHPLIKRFDPSLEHLHVWIMGRLPASANGWRLTSSASFQGLAFLPPKLLLPSRITCHRRP